MGDNCIFILCGRETRVRETTKQQRIARDLALIARYLSFVGTPWLTVTHPGALCEYQSSHEQRKLFEPKTSVLY